MEKAMKAALFAKKASLVGSAEIASVLTPARCSSHHQLNGAQYGNGANRNRSTSSAWAQAHGDQQSERLGQKWTVKMNRFHYLA